MRCGMGWSCDTHIVRFVHIFESTLFFSNLLVCSSTCRRPSGRKDKYYYAGARSSQPHLIIHELFPSRPLASTQEHLIQHPLSTNACPSIRQRGGSLCEHTPGLGRTSNETTQFCQVHSPELSAPEPLRRQTAKSRPRYLPSPTAYQHRLLQHPNF
jgi:hypothetical protein